MAWHKSTGWKRKPATAWRRNSSGWKRGQSGWAGGGWGTGHRPARNRGNRAR
jgi:hypothetical protein